MTKELTTKEKQELDSLSEEQLLAKWQKKNVLKNSKFNTILLDNNKLDKQGEKNSGFGTLSTHNFEGAEEKVTVLKEGFSFFPAYSRVQIECRNFITDQSGKQHPEYICREVNQFEDITVVQYDTREEVYTGPYKEAKEKYGLKYKVAIYAYYEGDMYRWLIGGKDTLGSWFGVKDEINDLQKPYSVKLKQVIPQNNSGIFWNNLEFELGELFDVKKALALGGALEKIFGNSSQEDTTPTVVEEDDVGEVIIDEIAV